ncbi:MAG TPA: hypothetical protein VIP09_14010 [Dehalococcoidia bacterium]|jgi:hypothetical protein
MLDSSEIEALNAIVRTLEGLQEESRIRVMIYLRGRLDGMGTMATLSTPQLDRRSEVVDAAHPTQKRRIVDIKQLKSDKSPRTDVEMAALVGYYLQEEAPQDERKSTFGRDDVEKYFKQAVHPLPKRIGMTLTNAKNAGYLDLVGQGEYRLNPVGYNLVAHSLPATVAGGRAPRAKPRTRRNAAKGKKAAAQRPKPRASGGHSVRKSKAGKTTKTPQK